MMKRLQNPTRSEALVSSEPSLTDAEARATLRRQFIGSVAAGAAVMAVVGLMAARPAHDISGGAERRVSAVQQPIFVAPADRVIAFRQR
jgi:hypothetical protein